MIRPDRLTLKASEALQQAVSLASGRGNPVVNDAHLFRALLEQEEGIVVPLLQKAGVNVHDLLSELDRELGRLPSQSGGAQPTLSRELNSALESADRLAQDPAVQEARIVKLPLNIDPKLPLSGNTVDKGEHGEGAADFTVLLVMKDSR